MEQFYALGVTFIEYIQYWFADCEYYFEAVNHLSNPHHAFEIMFPLISIVDSVFAAQFLLCIGFGTWLNAVLKWWLLEDRPYWWVRETTFYDDDNRPRLEQYKQTCETGPGCPSGHSTTVAMELMLIVMWISHVMNDRKCYVWWWKFIVYPLCVIALESTMVARMFVAAHFPHQCVLGAAIGLFLSPALCIYVSDPFVWGHRPYADTMRGVKWHIFCALLTVAISFVTYWSLKLCGVDPQWSIKLAFRWCEDPSAINVATTPMFALVQSTASLLGWAAVVTPQITRYRHYTKDRSLILASITSGCLYYAVGLLQSYISTDKAWCYYLTQFIVYTAKAVLFLRVVPWVAMYPFKKDVKEKLLFIILLCMIIMSVPKGHVVEGHCWKLCQLDEYVMRAKPRRNYYRRYSS